MPASVSMLCYSSSLAIVPAALSFRDIPESMPTSVSMLCYSSSLAIVPAALSSRASGCACSLLGNGALEAFDLQGAIVPPAY